MPKKSRFSVILSIDKKSYELHDRSSSETIPLSENDPRWYRWLDERDSFSFEGKRGRLTLRKESRTRGSGYWYAYRRSGQRLRKRYLGTPAALTLENLEQAATSFNLADPAGVEKPDDLGVKSPQPAGIPPTGKQPSPDLDAPSPVPSLPVLTPKLRIPRLHSNLVVRDRLLLRLDAGFERKLTLVSAPAGFGKTTLVSQWIAERSATQPLPVAWLSLDEGDNDPVRFWRYLITACQSIHPNIGKSSLAGLPPSSGSDTPDWHTNLMPLDEDALLATLINELSQIPDRAVLVLEDYHLILSPQVQAVVAKLVEHLPLTLHLILITRSDPPLPLAKLRLGMGCSGALNKLRIPSLGVFSTNTPSPDASWTAWRPHRRMRPDASPGPCAPAGPNRRSSTPGDIYRQHTPVGYFTSEYCRPNHRRSGLSFSQRLDRLTGPLCDAVTGEGNGEQLLAELERAGLFLIPLDDTGQWYRYHALFAEAVSHEARFRLGEKTLSGCYLRASTWYEENGMLPEAVETALSARDYPRATLLIERFAETPQFNERHELYTLQRWLEQLPEPVLSTSPALSFLYAHSLVFLSFSDQLLPETMVQVENVLRLAEEGWRATGYLPGLGEVFAFWSLLAYRQGEISKAASLSRQALLWLPAELNFASSRVICLSITGEEERLAGQFEAARDKVLEALRLCEASGNLPGKRVIALGRLSLSKGELHQAAGYFRQVLAQAGEDVADREKALVGMALLDYEWNDLEKAAGEAQEALELATQFPDELLRARASMALAQILRAQGEIPEAQELLEELLARVQASGQNPLLQEVETSGVVLQLSLGDLAVARRWVTKASVDPALSPLLVREQESLLTARAWMVLREFQKAEQVLDPLLDIARKIDHTRIILEILLLKTLIFAASKHVQEARDTIREVLPIAYRDRYQRLFLDQGQAIRGVLKALLPEINEKHLADYVRTLMRAFNREGEKERQYAASTVPVEPLSSQELRILRLLEAGLSRQEIAQELVISVNTVKTHLQHIFQKLNVTNRSEAIQAREISPR
jgi:LuxR family maltose regulon positive regulatory protein